MEKNNTQGKKTYNGQSLTVKNDKKPNGLKNYSTALKTDGDVCWSPHPLEVYSPEVNNFSNELYGILTNLLTQFSIVRKPLFGIPSLIPLDTTLLR
jgi:hypothetical protein